MEEGLRSWNSFIQSKSGSQLYVLVVPLELGNFTTERYRKWWGKRHGNYLVRGIEALISGSRPSQHNGHEICGDRVRMSSLKNSTRPGTFEKIISLDLPIYIYILFCNNSIL